MAMDPGGQGRSLDWQAIADAVPVPVWVNAGPSNAWVNDALCTFTGRSLTVEASVRWAETIHPDDVGDYVRLYEAAFASRRPYEIEYRCRRADGQWRWMINRARPLFLGDEFAGFIGATTDITVQHEAQQGLQAEKAFLDLLLTVSRRLSTASLADLDAALDDALATIGGRVGADRVLIVDLDEHARVMRLVRQWQPAPASAPTASAELAFDQLPTYVATLLARETVHIFDVDRLDGPWQADRQRLTVAGLRSFFAVPVLVHQRVFGLIFESYAHPQSWTDGIAALQLVGDVFAAALALREDLESRTQAARHAERRRRLQEIVLDLSRRLLEATAATLDRIVAAALDDVAAYFGVERAPLTIDLELPSLPAAADGEDHALLHLFTELVHTATTRVRADEELRQSERRFRLLADHSTDLTVRIDHRGRLLYASAAARELLGCEPEQLTGQRFLRYVHEQDRSRVVAAAHRLGPGTRSDRLDIRLRRADGTVWWCEAAVQLVGDSGEVQATVREVENRKAAEDELRHRALHDALTGLANRTRFEQQLGAAIRSIGSGGSRVVGVLFLDLDGFKPINDRFGHAAGDAVLVEVAARLLSVVRSPSDLVARFGGDEFVLLLTGLSDPEDANAVAGRVARAFDEPVPIGTDRAAVIGVSIGIATTRDPHSDPMRVLRRADAAMYDAKQRGKGGWVAAPRPAVEANRSDTGGSDIGGSDTGGSDIGGSDTGRSDIRGSDTGRSDIRGSDTGESDTGAADAGRAAVNRRDGACLDR